MQLTTDSPSAVEELRGKKGSLEDGVVVRAWSAMSAVQEFAVSAIAAGLSHVVHHPLYTLKSQMMYYGPEFRFKRFAQQAVRQPGAFLFRGRLYMYHESFYRRTT